MLDTPFVHFPEGEVRLTAKLQLSLYCKVVRLLATYSGREHVYFLLEACDGVVLESCVTFELSGMNRRPRWAGSFSPLTSASSFMVRTKEVKHREIAAGM